MIDVTYDPEADAVYFLVGRGKIDHQRMAQPLILDLDVDDRIVGIEILSASRVLAPGRWQSARRPGEATSDAAE